jgi:hypothetical protein
MSIWSRIAEAKIAEAIENGEFDDLPGSGEPLALEDLSRIPSDLRLGYKIMRNAGVAPPEVELRKQIHRLDRLIIDAVDESERAELRRDRLRANLEYSIRMERAARLRR